MLFELLIGRHFGLRGAAFSLLLYLPMPGSAFTELRVHLVPAGGRLDFPRLHGRFAHVYRRQHSANRECIAHNACSPHLDQNPPMGGTTEYKVCYCDAAGTTVASSPRVPIQVQLAGMPTNSSLLGLR